jgi:hypothetical protein
MPLRPSRHGEEQKHESQVKPIFFISKDHSKRRGGQSGNTIKVNFDDSLEMEFKSFLTEKHDNPSEFLDEKSTQLKIEYN